MDGPVSLVLSASSPYSARGAPGQSLLRWEKQLLGVEDDIGGLGTEEDTIVF